MEISDYLFDSVKSDVQGFVKTLFEGGAWGHLSHPFEDEELTFQDLKDIIIDSLSGKLEVKEKTDGQQVSFSWKNNKLICARNKGHLKNSGQNALTKEGIKDMFADRPENVRDAFSMAVNDIESALSKISSKTLSNLFKEGKRFMSMEIITPITQNVIPYGLKLLVFHGMLEYNKDGEPIGVGKENAGEYLEKLIQSVNSHVQDTFTIRGPNKIILSKIKNFPAKKQQYIDELDEIMGNLKDSDQVIKLYIQKWTHLILDKADHYNYKISDEVLQDLINRWGRHKKTNTIVSISKKIDSTDFNIWMKNFDKNESFFVHKKFVEPLEILFLKLGADILENASGFLAAHHSEAAVQMAKEVKIASDKIRHSKDVDDIKKLEFELGRIEKIGGIEHISGTEGLSFY
jgi:hypothetical protein